MMANTLGLDDDLDPVVVMKALEAAFDFRFTQAEAARLLTVGDVHDVVLAHFSGHSHETGCVSALAFYRLRRAILRLGASGSLRPDTPLDGLTGLDAKRLLKALGEREGWKMPAPSHRRLGEFGSGLIALTLIGLFLGAVLAASMSAASIALRHVFGTVLPIEPWMQTTAVGLFLLFAAMPVAGGVLMGFDKGRMPAGCETLGGLAKKMAALNFASFVAEGAKPRERDLWNAMLDILADHTTLPRSEIRPETVLLAKLAEAA